MESCAKGRISLDLGTVFGRKTLEGFPKDIELFVHVAQLSSKDVLPLLSACLLLSLLFS